MPTKIIKRTLDGVVLYAGDDLSLDGTRATNGQGTDRTTTTANAVLIGGVELPADWRGGEYTYVGGAWALSEQGEVTRAAELAKQRAEVWERIKAFRDARSGMGHQANGYWFHGDAKSKTQQLGLQQKAILARLDDADMDATFMRDDDPTKPILWKTMTGQWVEMTPNRAIAVFKAASALETACHAKAEFHKYMVDQSAAPLAYDYTAGWPAVFVPEVA